MTRTRIVVFAKAPVPGAVKTRLIPALGDIGAARLAHQMLLASVTEAVEARDQSRAKLEVERLTRALKRAAAAIEGV